jgi:hypothetical protein
MFVDGCDERVTILVVDLGEVMQARFIDLGHRGEEPEVTRRVP